MSWVAPGKVVLLGEYAVLDGAPAVVAAVDCGVACTWTPGNHQIIHAPDTRFVAAALDAVHAPGGTWSFLPWRPVPTATKAGLGSSAAATVVAVRAGLEAQGAMPSNEEVRAIAHPVHQRIQGSGSGVDVAASAHGGVLRFEAGRCTPLTAPMPTVVWSGTSAATGPRVAHYLAWSGREAFVTHTSEIVARFVDEPISALQEAARRLGDMAEAARIPYWTPGLRRIVTLAERFGGGAKPSGAGGGDSAVALLPDPHADGRFRAACREEGFVVLNVRLATGARRIRTRGRAARNA